MTTWSYLIYDIIGPAGAIGFLGFLLSDTIQTASGVDIPWWIFALATFAIVWVLTHFGIRLSLRTTVIFGAIELLIMLALAFTFLANPGPGSSYTAPLIPANAPHGFGGVLAGMVFSVLALSGFEAPAPLAQETQRPAKFIGRAVMVSLFAIGGFYVFTSYATAIGWGTGNMAAFASNPNPYYALGHALWGAGWWFVVIAIINSAIGVGLACTNAASRVLYTMGQAGTVPARFGRLNPRHQTPTFAIAFIQLTGIVAILLVGLLLAPDDIFGFLGTITTLAVIILYIMANLALTAYIRREHPGDYNFWRHAVLPWVGTLALLPVLFVTIYPVPSWPFNLTPYIFIVALIIGFGYMVWRESRHPGVLRRGATVLVGRSTDEKGDVDWDAPSPPSPQAQVLCPENVAAPRWGAR
jgi:amino acid transporter